MKKAKILFYDIETTPNLGYVWGKYQQDVLAYSQESRLLSFAYKWQGQNAVTVLTTEGKRDDKRLVKELHRLLNKADIVVAHNGDDFDNKRAQARFIVHGLKPPSLYKSVDTLKIARKYFKFNSNRLNDLGSILGLGKKVDTGGIGLWLGCMEGDPKAWKKMVRYNRQDVVLLEKVYNALLPWHQAHPSIGLLEGRVKSCPKCGSDRLQSRGFQVAKSQVYRQYQCQSCFGWCRSSKAEKGLKQKIV